jgi:hypothetical protein
LIYTDEFAVKISTLILAGSNIALSDERGYGLLMYAASAGNKGSTDKVVKDTVSGSRSYYSSVKPY